MKLDGIGDRAGRAVRENVAHIIFGTVVLLMIFLSFVTVRTEQGTFNWFNFAVNMGLQLTVFVPYRWRQKSLTGRADPYLSNKREYSAAVKAIHANNRLSRFTEFCEQKTEELRRARQLEIVHAVGIDTAVWESGKLPDNLTPKQRKAIERAKQVRVRPVNPFCITSNGSHIRGYGLEFSDTAEDATSVISKILPMFLWSAILTFIVLDLLEYNGIMTVVMIVFRLVMCLSAMFTGIMSGTMFVAHKDKVILRRIDFIRLFNEWLLTVEPEQKETAAPSEPTQTVSETPRFE